MNDAPRRFARALSENRRVAFDGAPLRALPGWASPVRLDGLAFELFPPADFEIAYRIPDYFLFAPYARALLDVSLDDEPPRRVICPAGSIFFAPPELTVRARMTTPVEFLLLSMAPPRAEALFAKAAPDGWWEPRVVVSKLDPGFAALQLEVRRSLLGDPLVERAYLGALGDAMVTRIGRHLACAPTADQPRETLPPGRLRRLVEQIDRDLTGHVTVAALAEAAGLSRSHFSRAFQAATGEPPQAFIIGRRICRARDLLAETARPIADIAAQTGFSSHAHLSTAFKKRLGVSPAEYRRAFETGDVEV